MNRRRMIQTPAAFGLGALLGASPPAFAQDQGDIPLSTPGVVASGIGQLVFTVESTSPQQILDTLAAAPVTSPYAPADAGTLTTYPWTDDTDVAGTVGALQVNGSAGYLIFGAYAVYPDRAAAIAAIDAKVASGTPTDPVTIGSLSGIVLAGMFGPVTLLRVGQVIVWGFGMPNVADFSSTPEAEIQLDLGQMELQSLSFAITLLDHLNRVLIPAS